MLPPILNARGRFLQISRVVVRSAFLFPAFWAPFNFLRPKNQMFIQKSLIFIILGGSGGSHSAPKVEHKLFHVLYETAMMALT